MLVQMRKVLTPDQRTRFKALHDAVGSRNSDAADAAPTRTMPPKPQTTDVN